MNGIFGNMHKMCPINSTATFQELEQFHNISCTEATSTLVQQARPSYVRYSQLHETQTVQLPVH